MSGPESIDSFFKSRRDWIDVGVVERGAVDYSHENPSDGYDVVIRIDGAYREKRDAEFEAAFFRARLAGLGLLSPTVVALKDLSR